MEPKPYKPPVRELASRIYAALVVEATSISESGVKMAANAESLAKLSFKLADVFQGVEDELNSDNIPKNVGYEVASSDIASWLK